MKRRLASVLCVWLVLGLSAGAAAQQPDPNAEQEGKVKFDAAREALTQGDAKAARDLFQASLALNKTAGTLLNLAFCEEKLALYASASKHYQEVLGLLPATDDRVPTAKQRMADIEPRIPTLRIRLDKGAPAGTTVLLDEQELPASALDTEMRLDPGKHTIRVNAAGHATKRYEAVLGDGEKKTLTVSPVPETSGARPSPSASVSPTGVAPATSPGALRAAGFVTSSVAGAVLAAGAVTGGLALARRQDLDKACPGNSPRDCDPALQSDYAGGKALADASTAMFVIGGAALAGGVVMVLVGSRSKNPTPGVSLAIGPGALSIRGRF